MIFALVIFFDYKIYKWFSKLFLELPTDAILFNQPFLSSANVKRKENVASLTVG